MEGPYRLINETIVHDGPVRSLTSYIDCTSKKDSSIGLVTGCQSNSPNTRRWSIDDNNNMEELGLPIFHNHWVTALITLEKEILTMFPDGLLITGCYDAIIRVYSLLLDNTLLMNLHGHEKGTISFSWTYSSVSCDSKNRCNLVSGSWDGSARIWDLQNGGVCLFVLGNQENGIHVLGLESINIIVTTSTGESINGKVDNYKIRFWDALTGKQVGNSICGHSGSIRSICSIPSIAGFATTSNDGSVVIRSSDGESVSQLFHPLTDDGMPTFVLDCCSLKDNSTALVSCAENGSVIIWKDFQMLQEIIHPCCVWTVLALDGNYSGDFITAGDDGLIRHFSSNPIRSTSESAERLTLQLMEQVEELRIKRHSGPSDEELAKATKWEERGSIPGKTEGQVMLFNKNNELIAAQWSLDSQIWIEVGHVTGKQNKGTIAGIEYDHVLPVEIETSNGVKELQLGYNNGENTFVSAQRFIDANQLSQSYLSQIADWITQRIGQSNTPTLESSTPIPSTSSHSNPIVTNTFNYCPTDFIVYDDLISGFSYKVGQKIQEFNNLNNILTSDDIIVIESLLKVLSEKSFYHSSQVSITMLRPIMKMLLMFNQTHLFPIFDILRLVMYHPDGSLTLSQSNIASLFFDTIVLTSNERGLTLNTSESLISLICQVIQLISHDTSDKAIPCLLTSIRFLCNTFKYEYSRCIIFNETNLWMTLFTKESFNITSQPKNIRVSFMNLLVNYSLSLLKSTSQQDISTNTNTGTTTSSTNSFILVLVDFMMNEIENIDNIHGSFIALGTILSTSNTTLKDILSSCHSSIEVIKNHKDVLIQRIHMLERKNSIQYDNTIQVMNALMNLLNN